MKNIVERKDVIEEGGVSRRTKTILWYLAFSGFALNSIIQVSFSMAIVEMTSASILNNSVVASKCILEANLTTISSSGKPESLERRFLDYFEIKSERADFKWNEHQQNLLLGSFYWMFWVLQLPGSALIANYGAKYILGSYNLIASLLCFATPLVSYLDFSLLVALRIAQGLFAGVWWNALFYFNEKWIPPKERSSFATAHCGSSIGAAVAYLVFGFILETNSWEWIFHFCGILGILWYMLWKFAFPELPSADQQIISMKPSTSAHRIIPWKAILTSGPVWINIFAQCGGLWSLNTILAQAPTYFKSVHGWNIEINGVLLGLPHLLRVGFSQAFAFYGNFFLRRDRILPEKFRSLSIVVSMIVSGFACLGLAYSGCNDIMAISFMALSVILLGATTSSSVGSIGEIAPNYADIISGVVSTFTVIPAFASPIVVDYFLSETESVAAWKKIFEVSAGMLVATGILYIKFNDTTVQSWNDIKRNTFNTADGLSERDPIYEPNRRQSDNRKVPEAPPIPQKNGLPDESSPWGRPPRSFRKSKVLIPFSLNSKRLSDVSQKTLSAIPPPRKLSQPKPQVNDNESVAEARERAMSLVY